MESVMGNAQYERARARARLALIAPMPRDVASIHLEDQSAEFLREANRRAADKASAEPHELLSEVLDAVARKYFVRSIRTAQRHQTDSDSSIPSPLARRGYGLRRVRRVK